MNAFEFIPEEMRDCTVTAWLHENEKFPEMAGYAYKRPAIIICPGGAYDVIAEREGEPVAKCYFAAGYDTFILRYSVKDMAKDFYPLCQLAATVAHIRKYAESWNIDREKVVVSGFSAGGHLACSLGTLFNESKFLEKFGRNDDIRPNAMVLSYPVIIADECKQRQSLCRVSGATFGTEEYQWFGLDTHVDSETPPTFIWHTAEDAVVPVEHSLRFAAALSKGKIPYELHVLPEGEHGLSVCNQEVNTPNAYNGRWVEWSIKWLEKVLQFEV